MDKFFIIYKTGAGVLNKRNKLENACRHTSKFSINHAERGPLERGPLGPFEISFVVQCFNFSFRLPEINTLLDIRFDLIM